MRTAKIYQHPGNHEPRHQPYTPPESRSEMMFPGKVIILAPDIQMGIQYKFENGDWQTLFKVWYQGRRIKDYQLDDKNQIDMRHTIRRLITRMATEYTDGATRPVKTLIVIESVPYTTEQ